MILMNSSEELGLLLIGINLTKINKGAVTCRLEVKAK